VERPASELPFNFGGLDRPLCDYASARFVVLSVPYEGTVTYQKGTARGPHAVIDASRNMELYDEELRTVTAQAGIHTLEALEAGGGPEEVSAEVERVVTQLLAEQKLAAMIGGEHSITAGAVAACKRRFEDLCVLQFDAHADLREEYDDSRFSHACVMKRCLELAPVTQVGIRSLSADEARLAEAEANVTTYFAHDLRSRGLAHAHREILSTLTDRVYLTIDVDVFDPAYVPGTGTPEPGGLSWEDVTGLIGALAREKQIVGFDVVEVMPIEGNVVSEFLAAKLIYRTMGFIARAARWL
jgi:agmatinase